MAKNDMATRRGPILRRILVSLLALGGLGAPVARSWAGDHYGGTTCPSPCSGNVQYIALSCGDTWFLDDGCIDYHWHTKWTDVFRVHRLISTSQNCKGEFLYPVQGSETCAIWGPD